MRSIPLLALLALSATSVPATAGEAGQPKPKVPPLVLKLRTQGLPPRSGAPPYCRLEIKNNTEKLIEGQLRFQIAQGQIAKYDFAGPEVALGSGKNHLAVMLPAASAPDGSLQCSVTLRGEERNYPLGTYTLGSGRSRRFVVGHCRSGTSADPLLASLDAILTLKAIYPADLRRSLVNHQFLVNGRARIAPEALPERPLAFLAYDILTIDVWSLKRLEARQRDALDAWLRAGGRILLYGDDRLGDDLLAWAATWRLPLEGERLPEDPKRCHRGLGRILVTRSFSGIETAIERKDYSWKAQGAWLWGIREDHRRRIAETGAFDGDHLAGLGDGYPDPSQYDAGMWNDQTANLQQSRHPDPARVPLVTGSTLYSTLMPESLKYMPLFLVFGILLVFIVVIGPVDYIVLRVLRLNRFTWITFPLVSIAFTVFIVMLSRSYMGGRDHSSSLVICDVDRRGDAVRLNRYHHYFLASHEYVVDDLDGTIVQPLDRADWVYEDGMGRMTVRTEAMPFTVQGKGIDDFVYRRPFRAKTPYVNRFTSFGSDGGTPLEIDWSAFEGVDVRNRPALRAAAAEAGVASDQLVIAFRGNSTSADRDFGAWVHQNRDEGDLQAMKLDHLDLDLIRSLVVAQRRGMHKLLCHVPPQAAGNFEDIPILDPSDADSYAIVVLDLKGQDLWMVRRIYRTEETL